MIGEEYGTIACMEGAKFQTLQGVARIGKGLEEISGRYVSDEGSSGGRKGVALSDGMGSERKHFGTVQWLWRCWKSCWKQDFR